LRAERDKKMDALEGYADRLERRAGPRFCPAEDGILVRFHIIPSNWCPGPLDAAPDHIDNLYDELEDPLNATKTIASVTTNEAGWLARYIREKSLRDREAVSEEVERELQVRISYLSLIHRVIIVNYRKLFHHAKFEISGSSWFKMHIRIKDLRTDWHS
jgi:hypothetical protein